MEPLRLVIMGVSGCGKSTVGQQLASHFKCDFLEGDSLHSQQNLALMAAGTPLSDEDRAAWLDAIAQLLSDFPHDKGLMVSCSALKRIYRDRLRLASPVLRFVHLQGDRGVLATRLLGRQGHFMPPSLLDSQLDILEPPGADENAMSINIAKTVSSIVESIAGQLAQPA